MDIKRVNTSKGLVIRYVFEDEAEYQTYMEYLSSIERCFDEEKKENIHNLIDLFSHYYDPHSQYEENRPVVTVFENHMLTIAAQLWILMDLHLIKLERENDLLTKNLKLLEEISKQE